MATDAVSNDPVHVLPVELHPVVDHLVTEDDTPVDNVFSEKQMRLLTEPLYSSWAGPGEQRSFIAMSNVGLFFSVHRPPLVPDVLLSLDVELPVDVHPKSHRSYFVWEYGKPPDVVIEVVSNREGGEDSEKLAAYARVAVRYYVIFDPERLLSPEVLRVYRLEALNFASWMSRSGFRMSDWGFASGRAVTRISTTPGSAGWTRKVNRSPRDANMPSGLPNNYGSLASNRLSRNLGLSSLLLRYKSHPLTPWIWAGLRQTGPRGLTGNRPFSEKPPSARQAGPAVSPLTWKCRMSTSSTSSVCAVCGQSLPSVGQDCPSCHASAAWQDLLQAAQFVRDRFLDWERDRLISRAQFTAIMEADNQLREGLKLMAREGKPIPTGIGLPPRDRCWRCNAELVRFALALSRVRSAGRRPPGAGVALLDLRLYGDQVAL